MTSHLSLSRPFQRGAVHAKRVRHTSTYFSRSYHKVASVRRNGYKFLAFSQVSPIPFKMCDAMVDYERSTPPRTGSRTYTVEWTGAITGSRRYDIDLFYCGSFCVDVRRFMDGNDDFERLACATCCCPFGECIAPSQWHLSRTDGTKISWLVDNLWYYIALLVAEGTFCRT